MKLLERVRADFTARKPFAGKTIGVSLHLEPKTAVLIETLAAGGARIVGTGNYGSTQDDVVAALRHWGITIFGRREVGWDEHLGNVRRVVEHGPDILLDNGADLVAIAIETGAAARVRGGTEETTSGDDRLRAEFPGKVPFPVIVINDSPLKQIVENKHAVGQGNVESDHADDQSDDQRPPLRHHVGYGWMRTRHGAIYPFVRRPGCRGRERSDQAARGGDGRFPRPARSTRWRRGGSSSAPPRRANV